MHTVRKAMAALRERALAAGADAPCVELVAPIYEEALLASLDHVEHRVVTELFTDRGWKPYPGVPLGSQETEALETIRAAASRSIRPGAPEVGDVGKRWIESRAVGRWATTDESRIELGDFIGPGTYKPDA